MPTRQKHRGQHPQDDVRFSDSWLSSLREAVHDYSWLRSRGYAETSALKLVGDRFRLDERQRQAVQRCACTDEAVARRQAKRCSPDRLGGQDVAIDGFNLLITLESALSGGFVFIGRDGAHRDLASIHGTYKRVTETPQAIKLAADCLEQLQVASTVWLLDSPVSNSGRLKGMIEEFAEEHHCNWTVELDRDPDQRLMESTAVVVSTDSLILDHAERWFDLAAYAIRFVDAAQVLRLATSVAGTSKRS